MARSGPRPIEDRFELGDGVRWGGELDAVHAEGLCAFDVRRLVVDGATLIRSQAVR